MKIKPEIFISGFVCLILFAFGFVVRSHILQAQYRIHGDDMPFTLESALQFRYARLVYETGSLPEVDKKIGYPDGVRTAATDSVGAEYVYAALARMFPESIPLAHRMRMISAGWFCLGIPFFYLWIFWRTGFRRAGFIAACFYAVSMASVIRSTGQELSRENFAMPFLVAHFAFGALARLKYDNRWFTIFSLVSSLFLALALAFWDLIQYYIIFWSIAHYVVSAKGALISDIRLRTAWMSNIGWLMIAGAVVPYLRAHHFVTSYVMLFNYGIFGALIAGCLLTALKKRNEPLASVSGRNRWFMMYAVLILMPIVVVLASRFLSAGYGVTYSHFASLLWAKIRFFNLKPVDPALLTFDQRILWAPALNSANFLLTKKLFLTTLPLSLIACAVFSSRAEQKSNHETYRLLFYFAVSLLSFILFVRMHVFLVVFASALTGLLAARMLTGSRLVGIVSGFVFLFCIAVETANTIDSPERWGRSLPYLDEQKELVEWLREATDGEPVLANFGLSAFIAAYADNPVILHPKFETPAARKKTREYIETLFRRDERHLRDWTDAAGAAYLVYSNGEFADTHIELQMRYCADAVYLPVDSAARMLEFGHQRSRYFVCLWENIKYKVFRIITRADEARADFYVQSAEEAWLDNRLKDASAAATVALIYDPGNIRAVELIMRISEKK